MTPLRKEFIEKTTPILKRIKGDIIDISPGTKPNPFAKDYINLNLEKKLPIKDNEYENTTCFWVLEHIRNPFFAVKEIIRITKPRGTILISVPWIHKYHADPKDYYRFSYDACKVLSKDMKAVRIIPLCGTRKEAKGYLIRGIK